MICTVVNAAALVTSLVGISAATASLPAQHTSPYNQPVIKLTFVERIDILSNIGR